MKKKAKRGKMKIYGELLSILKSERGSDKIILTHIQKKMNVPYDRLKIYISELETLNLIEDQVSYVLSQRGKEYLEEYKKILDFMERMGISI